MDLLVYGEIGTDVTSRQFADALAGRTEDINVRINSGGGSFDEANAIYTLLGNYPGQVTVHIDGMAASAATLIAMAGDEIRMADNAMWMIHLPSLSETSGNADELRHNVEMLDKIGELMVGIYSKRTRLPSPQVLELLKRETYMTASEALSLGFIDSVSRTSAVAASVHQLLGKGSPMAKKVRAEEQPLEMEEETTTKRTVYVPETPAAEDPDPATMEEEEEEPSMEEEETAAEASFHDLVLACVGINTAKPEDSLFLTRMQARKATKVSAQAAWMKELGKRAEAAATPGVKPLVRASVTAEDDEEPEMESDEETSCRAQVEKRIAALMSSGRRECKTRSDAMKVLNREHPALLNRYVQAVNSKRKPAATSRHSRVS